MSSKKDPIQTDTEALLPVIHRQRSQSKPNSSDSHSASSDVSLWTRLSAFLSMRAPNTQTTYLGIVNEWSEFLGAPAGTELAAKLISSAKDLHAMAYRRWLEARPGERPRVARKISLERAVERVEIRKNKKKDGYQDTLSNATIHKKFAALRRIYRMLVSTNLASENPFDVDRVPPPPAKSGQKRPTEMIPFALVNQSVAKAIDTTPKGLRDKAILSTLFGAGLRRSEVVALRLNDVCKTQQGTIFLRLRATKGKKDAEQALPGWAAKTITALVEQRLKEGAVASEHLFISYRGRGGMTPTSEPISDSGVYLLFKEYCERAGAGKFVTPHSARATAITKLLADGIPHRQVQEFSRHSSIQMVELYDKRRISVDENPGKELDFD